MSVRRLADDAIQPESFAFSEANADWAEVVIGRYPEGRQQSAVIPLLMRAQEQEGWVTKAAVEYVADRLEMPLIRVLEVATFYTQFQLNPVGTRAHFQVCGTTPCMLRGAEDIRKVCQRKIHPEPFHRNAEGTMSWEEVECQGACVNAPMVLNFSDAYEDLTVERFEEIVDLFAEGRGDEVPVGPQNGRHLSAPIGGLTTLTGDYDDMIGEAPKNGGSGPAKGKSHDEGGGTDEAMAAPPSKPGKPDSEAVETDPRFSGGVEPEEAKADPAAEDRESDELVAESAGSRSGKTGGTRQGATGAQEKDAAEEGEVTADTPNARPRTGGDWRAKEGAAEAAVLKGDARVDDGSGPPAAERSESADLTGRDQVAAGKPEGARAHTLDTAPGSAHTDHFASKAEGSDRERNADARASQKPANLSEGPSGEPDDLKRIRGIGPVIEGKLNGLGIYHFRQIAEWREDELHWVDDQLAFQGRALRDDWVGQAKSLQSDRGES